MSREKNYWQPVNYEVCIKYDKNEKWIMFLNQS
jgi:hypothetical protein